MIIFILKSKIDIGVSVLGTTRENRAGAGAGVGMVGWVGSEQKIRSAVYSDSSLSRILEMKVPLCLRREVAAATEAWQGT